MSDRGTPIDRAELRGWLRRAIRFGLLARLPPEFDPDGAGPPMRTGAYADSLLRALCERPNAEVVAEAGAFRDWANARLRDARKRLLAETHAERIDLDRLAPPRRTDAPPAEKPQQPPPHLRVPKEPNPLWDRWLDG